MRQAEIERNTFETKIKLSLNLDAQEPVDIQTGVGFFDHMLILFARHGRMWAIKQVSTVMERLLYLWMKPSEWQV